MPGRHRRKIVSQKQRAYLHAAAGRGEISEAQVHDMEHATKNKHLPMRSRRRRRGRSKSR